MLKSKKGLVVIGDILGICAKEKKPRFIRVPGDEDKSFRGYNTANELLESLHVDTKKVRAILFFSIHMYPKYSSKKTISKSADQVQIWQNAAFDQGLCCLSFSSSTCR